MNISQILTKLKSLVYSKSEADTLLSSKASSSHKHTKSEITDFPSLATVATSGSYNDLSNKPTIPTNTNQLTNGAGFLSADTGIKVTKGASISTSGGGYWAAMCNSSQNSSSILPTADQWWHVLSMDWVGIPDDVTNWCSQLALPTQQNSCLYWRRNDSGDTSINSSTWHKVIDDTNIGSQNVNYANSAGWAKVADYAKLLAYSHTDEINFKGGRQATCYFNYRNADDDSTGTAATVEYKFCNYGGDSVSNVTVSAGTFKENGSSLANKYVAKAGDTMTGTLKFSTENSVCLNLRPGNSNYYDTISVQTAGNEAVVFATKNTVTSWMFINGEDSVTNHADSRWKSLTPGLQIKSNKVAIGKLIADGANLTYPLEVNGTMSASSVVVTNNSSNGVLFGSYRVYVG